MVILLSEEAGELPNARSLIGPSTSGLEGRKNNFLAAPKDFLSLSPPSINNTVDQPSQHKDTMATVQSPLPPLPAGWSAEKDYKVLSSLSSAVQRNIEPVGPHFLAHARRVRFNPLDEVV